jgi:hypothetical protein
MPFKTHYSNQQVDTILSIVLTKRRKVQKQIALSFSRLLWHSASPASARATTATGQSVFATPATRSGTTPDAAPTTSSTHPCPRRGTWSRKLRFDRTQKIMDFGELKEKFW